MTYQFTVVVERDEDGVFIASCPALKGCYSGSHAVYRHPDGRWVTVPLYPGKDVAKGTLRKIIKDLGITVEEFESLH